MGRREPMAKISIYIALIVLFVILGALQTSITVGPKISNLENLDRAELRPPYTFILEDQFITGVFLTTYYQRYRLVGPYVKNDHRLVKVSKQLYEEHLNHLGLSLLCRNNDLIILPLPPGGCFLGEKKLGIFVRGKWRFHNQYQHLAEQLGWYDVVPTLQTYREIEHNIKNKIPYLGNFIPN
jgi:hypothetical protein